jgi:hypothetical protein
MIGRSLSEAMRSSTAVSNAPPIVERPSRPVGLTNSMTSMSEVSLGASGSERAK